MINSRTVTITDPLAANSMSATMEHDIRDRFRRSGYTLTSQRRAVLDALEEAQGHPSAEDVYLIVKRKNPKVALGTVYQALSVLEEIGVIGAKHWSESPTRYDLNLEPHLDIRCVTCGRVSEIPGVDVGDLDERIRSNTPYEVTRTTVAVEGRCGACQKASQHATP